MGTIIFDLSYEVSSFQKMIWVGETNNSRVDFSFSFPENPQSNYK